MTKTLLHFFSSALKEIPFYNSWSNLTKILWNGTFVIRIFCCELKKKKKYLLVKGV